MPKPQKTVATVTHKEIEELVAKATAGKIEDAAVTLFDAILQFAHGGGASDIHLEPWEEGGKVRVRVDGILHDEFSLGPEVHIQLIARLKILTRMRIDEHKAPQDGRFEFSAPQGDVDVRVSVIPTTFGEKAVLRLLSSQSHKLSLEQLGFSEDDLKKVHRAIQKPWGMILATGPTGSGKTTTIYAILEILNSREVNIATIEDPVEFVIDGINQSQVDQVAKLTFANGLRSLLRQDPDIIMVGEIRDQETAKIAVNAAMTGHKLLSTLHTNNAATTLPRLIDMGVEPFLISSTLLVAIAQRLVRRVCPDCTATVALTRKEATDLLTKETLAELFKEKDQVMVAKPQGCEKCFNTGYHGRVGIYEVLENSDGIRELITSRSASAKIEEQSIKEGMTTMVQDGVRKILSLQTTVEEFIRVMQE